MSRNKFDFYEVVTIKPKSEILDLSNLDTRKFDYQTLIGCEGVIMSMAQGDDGTWLYVVSLTKNEQEYMIREEDLQATGKKKETRRFLYE